jgi:lipid II:glycine glycyltransferase (peptidoglycan interpeptide bridge formation enzyme)
MIDSDWRVIENASSKHPLFFVFIYESKLGFKFIRNPFLTPYTGFHGTIGTMTVEDLNKAIHSIMKQLPKFDIFNMDLQPSVNSQLNIPIFTQIKKRTNLLELNSVDLIYKNFKPSLQRQIKKSERNLQIKIGNDISILSKLYATSLAKRGEKSHVPISFFKKVWDFCQHNQCGSLYYSIDSFNQIHAAILILHDETHSYYVCGGSNNKHLSSGAMSGLMWHAIKESIRLNKKYFDFEGSMIDGVNRFFKNFSPTEINYLNLQKTNSTIFKLLNKK